MAGPQHCIVAFEDLPGGVEQALAVEGEDEAAAGQVEDAFAQEILQAQHLMAYRRLRAVHHILAAVKLPVSATAMKARKTSTSRSGWRRVPWLD